MSERNGRIVQTKPARLCLKTYKASVSAVSSVDMLAPFVVEDSGTATAIKFAVCDLDIHDLTAVRDSVIPGHVNIPDGDNSTALASSYAAAELADREKKSGWWKSGIYWTVLIVCAVVAALLGVWLG